MFIATLLALLLVPQPVPQPSPSVAMEQFFTGVIEGSGTVHIMLSGRHGLRDRTHGKLAGPGVLLLDQVVEEEGKPARKRSWRLVRSGTDQVTGSISDARGPVTGKFAAGSLHLRYRLMEGPSVQQVITLRPDGRSATNRMSIYRLGFKVATVESVLHKRE